MNNLDPLVAAFEQGRLRKAIENVKAREKVLSKSMPERREYRPYRALYHAPDRIEKHSVEPIAALPMVNTKISGAVPAPESNRKRRPTMQNDTAIFEKAKLAIQNAVTAHVLSHVDAASFEDRLNSGALSPELIIQRLENRMPQEERAPTINVDHDTSHIDTDYLGVAPLGRVKKSKSRVTPSDARYALRRGVEAGAITVHEAARGEENLNNGRSSPAEIVASISKRAKTKTAEIHRQRRYSENQANRIAENGLEQRARAVGLRSGMESLIDLEGINYRRTHF